MRGAPSLIQSVLVRTNKEENAIILKKSKNNGKMQSNKNDNSNLKQALNSIYGYK